VPPSTSEKDAGQDGPRGSSITVGYPTFALSGDETPARLPNNDRMDLAEVRAEVAAVDALLKIIADRPVDVSDPEWMTKLRARPRPVDEAGVAPEAAAALDALLDAYEAGERDEVREIFRTHRSFRWGATLPPDWTTTAEFRRRLLLVSAHDQGADPRDELMTIWGLCGRARELGIDVEPVLHEVAAMSSGTDHYGFGSMRDLILRGRER
jgi:hypothetical protein